MFDLELAIADWRRQMLAAGIATAPLEELESHLREEIEQQTRTGRSLENAFMLAVRRMGHAAPLKTEFARSQGSAFERFQHYLSSLTHIPNPQLAIGMNISEPNSESRRATYLKNLTFILPAVVLWTASSVFVLPKLREICGASGTIIPNPILTAIAVSEMFKNYWITCFILFMGALALLEWRSRAWPQHRGLVFGIAAFTVNSAALIAITAMCILAVLAGANLLQHTK